MRVSFWNCEFGDYDEYWNEDGDMLQIFNCAHPNGTGICELNNKNAYEADKCILLNTEKVGKK